MEEALIAIIALCRGEFDNPTLMRFGPLHSQLRDSVQFIAEEGIKGEAMILDFKRSEPADD